MFKPRQKSSAALPPGIWDETRRLNEKHSEKFIDTYKMWNKGGYSGTGTFGNKMRLAHEFEPRSKEDWARQYFASGAEYERRVEKIKKDPSMTQEDRNYAVANLGILFGRTFDEMKKTAEAFRSDCANAGISLTKQEALNYTFIRTIDEGWIGYQREKAAERDIAEFCKKHGYTYEEAATDTDVNYGVDYEIYDKQGKLLCGVQVKGAKFRELQATSREFALVNRETAIRNILYEEMTGVPVLYSYVDKHMNVIQKYQESALLHAEGEFSLDDYIGTAIKEQRIKAKEIRKTEEKVAANAHHYENLEATYL